MATCASPKVAFPLGKRHDSADATDSILHQKLTAEGDNKLQEELGNEENVDQDNDEDLDPEIWEQANEIGS